MATFDDHSAEVIAAMLKAKERALTRVGMQAVSFATMLAPPKPTGNLKNSISFTVNNEEVVIGARARYAPYVELGTGIYYPGGRPTPWVYKDAEGNWHTTKGQRAQPFIKPAVADHQQTYLNIINDEMKNG